MAVATNPIIEIDGDELETERAELLYFAEEYEAVACADFPDRIAPFSVKIPK